MFRHRWMVSLVLLTALILGACQPITAPGEMEAAVEAATLDPTLVSDIESLIGQVMEEGQVPGAAVGVVKDGEVLYVQGFGVTKVGGEEPILPESVFVMASVTKPVTAMAIMQLAEEGKIQLDAPVTDYVPYFAMADARATDITIRQLLSHTSGMRDLDDGDRMADYRNEEKRIDEDALEDYVRSLSDKWLLFSPGEDWSYSSIGFVVLGDVIAKVSGQSFEEYMQEQILTPLGMGDSTFLLSEVDPAMFVSPHEYDFDGAVVVDDFIPYARSHAPSSTLFSTLDDMTRFALANLNHDGLDGVQVLPAAAYAEMWAPHASSPFGEVLGPPASHYGLGWWVGELDGNPLVGGYGAVFGYQTHLVIFPEENIAVVVMVNVYDRYPGTLYAYDIGNGVAELLLSAESKE